MSEYGRENMPTEKPELGCKPYYVVVSDRIEDLSEAIQRYSRKSHLDYNRIREWAKEIEMLCEIVKTLDGYGDGSQ